MDGALKSVVLEPPTQCFGPLLGEFLVVDAISNRIGKSRYIERHGYSKPQTVFVEVRHHRLYRLHYGLKFRKLGAWNGGSSGGEHNVLVWNLIRPREEIERCMETCGGGCDDGQPKDFLCWWLP